MVTNRIIFFATSVQPNPEEIDYWVDLSDNPYGGSIKYFNGTEWVRLAASGGMPDLSNYYTKTQVNKLLNDKANISDVDSKVDDEEVKDVIKDIQFNTSNPNGITMVMFKYEEVMILYLYLQHLLDQLVLSHLKTSQTLLSSISYRNFILR